MSKIDSVIAAASQATRITIDDVRQAIEGIDPNETNASKIRAMLGRGSFETIQRHLNTIRKENAPEPLTDIDQVPEMPKEAAQAMWTTAVQAAQVAVLSRTERLAAERDDALAHVEVIDGDMAELLDTLDKQAGTLAEVTAKLDEADTKSTDMAALFNAEKETMQTQIQTMETQIKTLASELEKEKTNAVHGAAIYESNLALMRSEVARLNNEVGELKSHLYKRLDTTPEILTPVKKGETK